MLICPQCQFENPEANRFCQSCGVSLTHKVCCQCGLEISIESKVCHSCGADNYTVLWAIVSSTVDNSNLAKAPELAQVRKVANQALPELEIASLADLFAKTQLKATPTLQISNEPVLLVQNRYVTKTQLNYQEELNSIGNSQTVFLQGQVVDHYPLQKSHLATLQKQQMDLFTELSQNLNDSYLAVTEYWNLVGLPTHALPYLILERYTPIVPKIYDAWQEPDQGVVLLPDRSNWKLITEVWSQKLPWSQIVWFLDAMVKLWEPLQSIGCAQSLLVVENLRIDEDEAFCIQQIYIDGDEKPTLSDLAQTWQFCLAESGLEPMPSLNLLLEKMIVGEIFTVEQLRLELHNLDIDEVEVELIKESEPYAIDFLDLEVSKTKPQLSQLDNIMPQKEEKPLANNLGKFNLLGESKLEEIPALEEIFFDEAEDDIMYSSELEEQETVMIPVQLRNFEDASCTNIGMQRDHNEDFFGIKTTYERNENNTENSLNIRGLYIVCDGMGGHAAGEVASAMAVESLQQYFKTNWQEELPDHQSIESAVLLANKALYQTNVNNARSGNGRMGTTLVMALVQNTQMAIAHVGDSRIYRLSHTKGLEQLTQDHEVGQREINRGVEPEIAYGRPDAYQLTQALGPRDNKGVRPDIQFLEITEDSLILLCSDGFCDNNFLEGHSQHLQSLIDSDTNLQHSLFELVDLANEHNGHDNITAVLLRIKLKPDF